MKLNKENISMTMHLPRLIQFFPRQDPPDPAQGRVRRTFAHSPGARAGAARRNQGMNLAQRKEREEKREKKEGKKGK